MTTIVYSHDAKEIAYDSRVTGGHSTIYSDDCEKSYKFDDAVVFAAGAVSDIEEMLEHYRNGVMDVGKIFEASALVVTPDRVFSLESNDLGNLCSTTIDFNFAIGSGGHWALAALDFGESPKEAVAYAATKDCSTGGTIRNFIIGG